MALNRQQGKNGVYQTGKTVDQARQVIKMQWPIRFRAKNDIPEPPPQPAPSRPLSVTELIAKLLETEKSASILVKTAGRLMVIATGCIIAIVLAILFAANGINVPRHEIALVGAGGATAVTLVTALLTHWIKKLMKASRDGAANDRTPDGKQ